MTILGQSAFLKALGWALLNSFWQFGLLWLVFVVFIRNRERLSPGTKHGVALGLLVTGFIWFGTGLSIQYLTYTDPGSTAAGGFQLGTLPFYTGFFRTVNQFLDSNLAYLSVIYLAIVSTLFTKFAQFFYYAHTIQTRGLSRLPADLRIYVQQLVHRLSIHRKVHVWVSELIDTPMVIGFLKPTILIPIASINQLSVQQLEAILLHEMAHIKRHDYLVNLYVATMEVLFFFNPFSRLLLQSIKQEREKCCDDCVLQFNYDPHQYASALLKLEQNRPSIHPIAMAATGSSKKLLLNRIQRIMGVRAVETQQGFKLLAYFLTVGLLCFIALVNPGDLIKARIADHISLVVSTITPPEAVEHQSNDLKSNIPLAAVSIVHTSVKRTIKSAPRISHKPASTESELLADYEDDSKLAELTALESGTDVPEVVEAVHEEVRDFTTPELEKPDLPAAAAEYALPFVPYSSFSYQNPVDTGARKVKQESYEERVARESLIRAQSALNKLDWKKIGKSLKQGKADALTLRQQIQTCLQDLNWKQINQEVRDSLNQAQLNNTKESLSREYELMNAYKSQQSKLDQLTKQLRQQQDVYKKNVEVKLYNVQEQVKKTKVVVYF
jgi:beta-lactamase regulating signal transducer with metallopeptidase domain